MSTNWENVEFKGDKRFLSNMYPCVFTLDGNKFASSENYYMYMKFAGEQQTIADKILTATPREAKVLARSYSPYVRSDWHSIKVGVMRTALLAKFTQNPDLRTALLATGDEHLEERNDWYDTFWGTYLGKGSNTLGVLLMELRTQLQTERIN